MDTCSIRIRRLQVGTTNGAVVMISFGCSRIIIVDYCTLIIMTFKHFHCFLIYQIFS